MLGHSLSPKNFDAGWHPGRFVDGIYPWCILLHAPQHSTIALQVAFREENRAKQPARAYRSSLLGWTVHSPIILR
ncbi:MAG: hypothetical protein KDJ34_05665, partial [Candidatus Competibacteraceae bacterium]|nr:hypothetical protein [Candidatus Competibacteraceae bacterium]